MYSASKLTRKSTNKTKSISSSKTTLKEVESLREKLYVTEDALRIAEKSIAKFERKEKQKNQLLSTKVLSDNDESDISESLDPVLHAKVTNLKHLHAQKVKSLMKSLDAAKKQVATLKGHDKEHRRSALIQSLRKQQRSDELVIDFLKQTVRDKLPEFNNSSTLVNEFVIKKTIGGPKRFRPKTREELENEIATLKQQTNKKTSTQRVVTPVVSNNNQESKDEEIIIHTNLHNDNLEVENSNLMEEVDRLQVLLESRNVHISSIDEQLVKALSEVKELESVREKCIKVTAKYKDGKDKITDLRQENLKLLQEKERALEANARVLEEVEFLKDQSTSTPSLEKLERLERELSEAEEELLAVKKEASNDYESANVEIKKLESVIEKQTQDYEKQSNKLKAELVSSQQAVAEAQQELENLQSKIREKSPKKSPQKVASSPEKKPLESSDGVKEIEALSAELLEVKQTVEELEDKVRTLTEEKTNLQKKLESTEKDHSLHSKKLVGELNEMEVELDDALLQLEIQETCHQEVRKHANTLRTRYEKLGNSYPLLPTEKEISKRIRAENEEDDESSTKKESREEDFELSDSEEDTNKSSTT